MAYLDYDNLKDFTVTTETGTPIGNIVSAINNRNALIMFSRYLRGGGHWEWEKSRLQSGRDTLPVNAALAKILADQGVNAGRMLRLVAP